MYSNEILSIDGYGNQPVPHAFFKQEGETSHAVIILPGWGSRARMPWLAYSASLMLTSGADVLRIEYAYGQLNEFQALDDDAQDQWFFTDVESSFRTLLQQRDYEEVTLIGKSIGTLAMGHLLAAESAPSRVQAIWFTPLLGNEKLRKQILQFTGRSLFVIGTADRHYDATLMAEIEKRAHCMVIAVEGGNHGLNVGSDVVQSIEVMQMVMRDVETFVAGW